MSANQTKSRLPLPGEEAEPHGTMLIIVPMVIVATIIVSLVVLHQANEKKRRLSDLVRVEEEVRENLRKAYRLIRESHMNRAMAILDDAGRKLDRLMTNRLADYGELQAARLLMEGEAAFVLDGERDPGLAEGKFTQALSLMTRASGEYWMFGIFGRGRVRLARGDFDGAVADFNLLLDNNPSFGSAYYWRSIALSSLGQREAAARDEEMAKRLDSWPPLRMFLHQAPGPEPALHENRDVLW